MKEFICNVAAALGTVAMMWLLLIMAATTPEGGYDSLTDQCIGVVDRAGRLVRCENAPRHQPINVAPGTTFEELQQRFEEASVRGDVIELFPGL